MKIATQKFLFIAAIFLAVVLMVGGVVGYRQYVHAMACYVSCSTADSDTGDTLITNTSAVPTGYCGTYVTLAVNGVSQTPGSFSGFTYVVSKVKSSGSVINTPKTWVGDNTDTWFLNNCSSAGYPMTYSAMASTIPSGYYPQSTPTYSGGNGTCTYSVTNNCAYANNSGSCSLTSSANNPPSQFTRKLTSSAPPCLSGFGFSLCSYGTVNVSANITGGSWTVTGPFGSSLPISNTVMSGSGTASSWATARVGSYSISVTPPSGYTYTVSPSATQSIGCALGQSITFNITFNSANCTATTYCPSTANNGTCSGYTASSATYATLCSSKYTTATCSNGTWTGTMPLYPSCTQYCATSGACSGYSSGQVCYGYNISSATSPTMCSSYYTNATCQSGGTWSTTPPAYSSCSQYYRSCSATGICSLTANGGTCSGYSVSSATYSNMCSSYYVSATCNDGTWTGTIPTYSSCSQYCAASGACPVTLSGGTCTSYASSAPLTTCSAISSTCQSNGTWSKTPGAYSSCSNPCAASGGCPITASGGSCTSYSTNSATGPNTCSTYARTSTCSNGAWSLAPYSYSSCSQSCSTGSVSLSPSTITVQGTTALSAPSGWSGGTFSSASTTIMTVSGSTGTGKYAGSTIITGAGWTDPYGATSCPLSGATATVRGTYTITPSVSLFVGSTTQMYGYYSADGLNTATTTTGPVWSSNNTGVATISSSGVVTGVSTGTSTITSVYQGVTATGLATVSLNKGCTISASPNPATATTTNVTWSSTGVSACSWTSGGSGNAGTSGSSPFTISGPTTFALNCDSGATVCSTAVAVACPTGSVTATPSSVTLPGSPTTALSAPPGWTNGTFSSNNTSVLTVSGSTGTGVRDGTASVSGSSWNFANGATNCSLSGTNVTVTSTCQAGSVTASPSAINAGATTTFSAPSGWSGGTFTSTSSSIISIAGSIGTGIGGGVAVVAGTGWTDQYGATQCPLSGAGVTVYQPTLSVMGSGGNNAVYIGVGKTAAFTSRYSFNGVPSNNVDVTASSTWSSNNTTIASSLGGGSFRGLNAGSASITANYAAQNMTATGTLNVVQCKATDVTITIRSGINTPMAGVPITVSASAGTLTATGGTTDANGQFKTSLVGPIPASAVTGNTSITITATAEGVVLTKQVTFSAGDVCYANQIGLGPQSGSTLYASAQSLGGAIVDYFGKMFWTILAPGKNK